MAFSMAGLPNFEIQPESNLELANAANWWTSCQLLYCHAYPDGNSRPL